MENFILERTVSIQNTYDIVVCGAGPTGVCAAVAAAREGSKVALIERYGILGGNLTVGYVGPILGMVSKGTMRDEIVELLDVPFNDMIGEVGKAHNFEKTKLKLEELIDKENIDVYLQSSVCDVIIDGNNIKGVVLSSNGNLFALKSNIVIDSTGDGSVAALAGCEFQKGREDGLMQPVTNEFTLAGVDEEKGIICIGDVDDVELLGMKFHDYCLNCVKEGDLPELLASVRLHPTVTKGHRQVNTTQENGVDMTNPIHIFKADLSLRKQIETLVNFFRKKLPGYENCYVLSSGTTTGVRETRRIIGEYIINSKDLTSGRRFEDVLVHKANFIVDIHNPDGAGQADDEIQYVKPYDIPYRCFIPKVINNLYVAGRCISGTHRAHASYRVMSICMAMGEAIGIAASICINNNTIPRKLDAKLVQAKLIKKGVDLFSN